MAKMKWTFDKIKEWGNANRPNYIILDHKIEKNQHKIKLKCDNAFHEEFWMFLNGFLKGSDCELCGFKKISTNKTQWTDEKLHEYIKTKLNFIIINIKRDRKYIELTMKDGFGYFYVSRLTNIIHHKEIKIVHTKNPYTIQNIHNWIKVNNKNYTLCSTEYVGHKGKMKWQCLKCREYFYNCWMCISNDQGCTNCSEKSKGENEIKLYLNNNNIEFQREYLFDECRGKKKPLPFDFYIPSLDVCVEYDGKHHFKPIDFAGKGEIWAEENLKTTQQNDQLKNEYCLKNNIPLLRIKYTDFDNIESILTKELQPLLSNPNESTIPCINQNSL